MSVQPGTSEQQLLSRNSISSESFLDQNVQLDSNQSLDLITKSFLNMNVRVIGTNQNPLFNLNDCGIILEIKNIRDSTKSFNEKQKLGVDFPDPHGRIQRANFLTEVGLYKLIFISRSQQAEKFQDWVYEIIKEIRQTGSYQLQQENVQLQQERLQYRQKQLEYQQKEIEYQKQIKKQQKQLEEKNKYVDIPLLGKIYIGQEFKDTDEYWKVGCKEKKSKRKDQQSNSHTHGYGHFHIQPCINETHLEKQIHHVLEKQDYHHRGKIYHCKFEFIKAVTRILGSTFDVLYKSRWQMTEQDIRKRINERLDEDKEIVEDSFTQQDEQINQNNQENSEEMTQQDTTNSNVKIDIQQLNDYYETKIELTNNIKDQIKKKDLFREYNQYSNKNLNYKQSVNYYLIDAFENYLRKNKKNVKYQNWIEGKTVRAYTNCRILKDNIANQQE